jgi:single-stranded DNA-binding protein
MRQHPRVACFCEVAERAVKRLTKGSRSYIQGALGLNEWTDFDGREGQVWFGRSSP